MNGTKAQGVFGLLGISTFAIMGLILAAFASQADEQASVSSVQDATQSIPILSATVTNDTLTLSWPVSATNWMLSTQSVNARGWNLAIATSYNTNAKEIYMTTSLPMQTTFYRLIKTPPGFRNSAIQPAQSHSLPPLPKPVRRARPTNAPPHS